MVTFGTKNDKVVKTAGLLEISLNKKYQVVPVHAFALLVTTQASKRFYKTRNEIYSVVFNRFFVGVASVHNLLIQA